MGYKDVETVRACKRSIMREHRAWLKEHHFCENCKTVDAFTMIGKPLCAECRAKKSEYERNRRHGKPIEIGRRAEAERAKRKERRERRLCTECGSPLPGTGIYPYVMCERCRSAERSRQERRRREAGIVPKQEWREQGLCVRCGKPRADGLTAWGGEPILLCADCYSDTVRAGRAGRDAYYHSSGTTWGNYQYEYERRIRHGQERSNP